MILTNLLFSLLLYHYCVLKLLVISGAKSESLGIENKSGFFTRVERSLVLIVFLIISQPIIGLYILAIGTLISSLWRLASGLKKMLKTKLIFLFSLLFFLYPSQVIFADSDKEVEVGFAITEVYFPEKITFLFERKTKKRIQDIKLIFLRQVKEKHYSMDIWISYRKKIMMQFLLQWTLG